MPKAIGCLESQIVPILVEMEMKGQFVRVLNDESREPGEYRLFVEIEGPRGGSDLMQKLLLSVSLRPDWPKEIDPPVFRKQSV